MLGRSRPRSPTTRGRRCARRRGRDARHGRGGRRGSLPAARLGVPQRRHVVARRRRDARAGDRRGGVPANVTNEGGVEGTLPRAAERHRSLAAPRVPPRVGRRGPRATRTTSSSRSPRPRRLCGRSSTRTSPPSPSRATCRARSPSAARARASPSPQGPAETARCILESLALKHAETVELVAAGHRHGARRAARRRRRRPQRAALPLDGGGCRACRCSPGPRRRRVIGNLLVQAIALGELGSLADAREVVRRSFPLRIYEPTGAAEWQEARERFADRGCPAGGRRRERHRSPATGSRSPRTAGTRRPPAASACSTASSTARTCSAPTARSPTRAAETRLQRGCWSITQAGRCACSGSRARAPTSRRSRRRASPCLRLDELLPLREREEMDDATMVAYLLRCAVNPDQPRPSIETLLHAFVPADARRPHARRRGDRAHLEPERAAARRGGLRRRGGVARLPAARLRHVAEDRAAARGEPRPPAP